MSKVNEEKLLELLSKKHGGSVAFWDKNLEAIKDSIKELVISGSAVKLSKFGQFLPKLRKGRIGRNPQTGESITIKDTKVVKFKISSSFKKAVRG